VIPPLRGGYAMVTEAAHFPEPVKPNLNWRRPIVGKAPRPVHARQAKESIILQTRPVFVGELAHRFELPQHQFQVRGPQ
jgi:hypothetical protein